MEHLPYPRIGDVRGAHHYRSHDTIRRGGRQQAWEPLCNVPRGHLTRITNDAAWWNPVLRWQKQRQRDAVAVALEARCSLTLVGLIAL
ncbi:hypothetical protein IG631_07112 [Alternaria alternata]|nr:hypothetical protein IG631_07112 [Alternaria alternata]